MPARWPRAMSGCATRCCRAAGRLPARARGAVRPRDGGLDERVGELAPAARRASADPAVASSSSLSSRLRREQRPLARSSLPGADQVVAVLHRWRSRMPETPRTQPTHNPKKKETSMNDQSKVTADHLRRDAYLYVRQSSLYQVANNTESAPPSVRPARPGGRARLARRAGDRDRRRPRPVRRDRHRPRGFQRLVADVSLGKAGIVLGLECSRLARNNADWHRCWSCARCQAR